MTAPVADLASETSVSLEIPCECQAAADHGNAGCCRPADVWAIYHDVVHDCRKRPDGNLSQYLCSDCWNRLCHSIDGALNLAVQTRRRATCAGCDMTIRRRTDIVRKVTPLRGTTR